MEVGAEPCELLPWDTKFFGVNIARVRGDTLTPALCNAIDTWCREHRINCLYFIARPDDADTVRLAEGHGYHLTDVRMTFERSLVSVPSPDTPGEGKGGGHPSVRVRSATASDIPALRRIANAGHTETRFYYDDRFPRHLCELLYETWIQRSCEGYAQEVLVAEDAEAACGYVSCHLDEKGQSGSIGLLAVDQAHHGKGVGRALVDAALQWFAAHGATLVSVVTQGRNVAAQRLYVRCGFIASKLELYYHRWL